MNRKKSLAGIMVFFMIFGMACVSSAALVTIGTATYDDGSGAQNYNLIYDADAPLGPIVWLDYTHAATNWWEQDAWSAGLSGQLSINTPGYTVTWTAGETWRLPNTGTNPGAGYNQTGSEMGHLWYDEFLFSQGDAPTADDLNATNFDNLVVFPYWSGPEYAKSSDYAFEFSMSAGHQGLNSKDGVFYGLAVRRGEVSAVPIPGALYLFSSGLFGLVAVRRRKKG